MHRLLTLLVTLISIPCFAQVTVTQSSFPRKAVFIDTILSTTQTGLQVPATGPARNWDYTNITTGTATFRAHSDATNDSVFQGALNSFQAEEAFQSFSIPTRRYEAIDNNGWFLIGQAISDIPYPLLPLTGNSDDTIRFVERRDTFDGRINPVRFPCTFLTQWTGTREEKLDFELTINSAGLNQAAGYREREVTDMRDVVGFGRLIIPGFSGGPTDTMEVLQIEVIKEEVDSFYLQGNPMPDSILNLFNLSQGDTKRDTFYVFFKPGYAGVVLRVNVSGGEVKSVVYRPQAGKVELTSIADRQWVDMKFYPNPVAAGGRMNITLPSEVTGMHRANLVDMLGRQLYGTTLADPGLTNSFMVPAGISPGFYVLQIIDQQGRTVSSSMLQVR